VRGDDGQILVLTLGYVVIALLLVTVVASATAVHLERKRLLALADLVALESADALAEHGYFPSGAGNGAGLPLSDASVRVAVEDYLRDNPGAAAGLDDLTVLSATTPDGRSAEVRLGAVARPAVVSWVLAPWTDGIALQAESVARAS